MFNHHNFFKYLTASVIAVFFALQGASQVNYIRTFDAKAPEQNANKLLTGPLRDVLQTTQYLDGLGRPLQTVVKQGSYASGSTAPVDMVAPVVYDAFGREAQKYLPYAATTSDGLLKPAADALTQQAAFYNGTDIAKNPIAGQGETFFYSQTNFEASPLNRVMEQFAPGNNWAGTASQTAEADRKSVKIKYYVNTTLDDVKIWMVTNGAALGDWGSYAKTGEYPAGTLYKIITIDEHNKQVIELKDKEGKVILKKVQLEVTAADEGAGQGYTGWMCTYYIYDDFGNLRCVIQPEGVKALEANGWAFNSTILEQQCFRYEYDHRQRMIKKKVAGAGQIYMVYDARDRLVMTQDAKMRSGNKWHVTLYDQLNRPEVTGILINDWNYKTFAGHLSAAANSTGYPFLISSPPPAASWFEVTRTFYDNYDWRASWSNPLTDSYNSSYDTYFLPPL